MIAYNSTWLDALRTSDIAKEWHRKGLISDEKWKGIQTHYAAPFYSPNIFVRIGLAFFCLILLLAAIGLIGVFISVGGGVGFSVLCVFFAAATLFFLETWAIQTKGHYGSGVDDMLLYFSIATLFTGFMTQLPYYAHLLVYYCIAWPFLVAGSIRYIDRLLAAAAYVCSLNILLLIINEIPGVAIFLLPFAGILFSAAVYFFARKGQTKHQWRHWHPSLVILEMLSLATFYMSGNYWIIQQAGTELFQIDQPPLRWFFWAFTFVVPALYLFEGLRRKERMLLDIGVACIAAAAFTFRYYFHVFPLAWTAVAAGAFLFATSYFTIRYLRQNDRVFTYAADGDSTLLQEIEEQLIEQTIATQNPPAQVDNDGFGGGEFGGGGAGADF